MSSPLARRALPDWRRRERASRARADLNQLSVACIDDGTMPPIYVPMRDLPELMGVAYVFEGSTLGGQVLTRILSRRLGIEANAMTYINGYGEDTGAMWKSFVTKLDQFQFTTSDRARAVHAANRTFDDLLHWLAA